MKTLFAELEVLFLDKKTLRITVRVLPNISFRTTFSLASKGRNQPGSRRFELKSRKGEKSNRLKAALSTRQHPLVQHRGHTPNCLSGLGSWYCAVIPKVA